MQKTKEWLQQFVDNDITLLEIGRRVGCANGEPILDGVCRLVEEHDRLRGHMETIGMFLEKLCHNEPAATIQELADQCEAALAARKVTPLKPASESDG